MKRVKSFVSSILVTLLLLIISTQPVSAQTPAAWSGDCVVDGVATVQGLSCLISNVFSVAITFIGLAAFVMLLIGGFGYMLSGGNSKGTETARNTITFAIVGIVVALSAFIILNLIANFTGVQNILEFTIPS